MDKNMPKQNPTHRGKKKRKKEMPMKRPTNITDTEQKMLRRRPTYRNKGAKNTTLVQRERWPINREKYALETVKGLAKPMCLTGAQTCMSQAQANMHIAYMVHSEHEPTNMAVKIRNSKCVTPETYTNIWGSLNTHTPHV